MYTTNWFLKRQLLEMSCSSRDCGSRQMKRYIQQNRLAEYLTLLQRWSSFESFQGGLVEFKHIMLSKILFMYRCTICKQTHMWYFVLPKKMPSLFDRKKVQKCLLILQFSCDLLPQNEPKFGKFKKWDFSTIGFSRTRAFQWYITLRGPLYIFSSTIRKICALWTIDIMRK